MYGVGVITAITSQNTNEVKNVYPLHPRQVRSQLEVLFDDVSPLAIKTGMLGTAENVKVVASTIAARKAGLLIVDPVLKSTSGFDVGSAEVAKAIKRHLLPIADMVTPNLYETEALTGIKVETASEAGKAAQALADLGAGAVCITGGHFSAAPTDIAFYNGKLEIFSGTRQGGGEEYHGTGCFFSAALTCLLAKGAEPGDAVSGAKKLVERAISGAIRVGGGFKIPWLNVTLEPDQCRH